MRTIYNRSRNSRQLRCSYARHSTMDRSRAREDRYIGLRVLAGMRFESASARSFGGCVSRCHAPTTDIFYRAPLGCEMWACYIGISDSSRLMRHKTRVSRPTDVILHLTFPLRPLSSSRKFSLALILGVLKPPLVCRLFVAGSRVQFSRSTRETLGSSILKSSTRRLKLWYIYLMIFSRQREWINTYGFCTWQCVPSPLKVFTRFGTWSVEITGASSLCSGSRDLRRRDSWIFYLKLSNFDTQYPRESESELAHTMLSHIRNRELKTHDAFFGS